MPDFHVLDRAADAEFLRAGVADPLTRVAFRPTNRVARCATCGLVSLRETWEAVGGCPNGHPTMGAWDPRAALGAWGDGASAPAVAPTPAPTRRPAWLWPVAALVAAVLLLGGLYAAGVFDRDETSDVATDVPTAGPSEATPVEAEAGETEGRLDEGDFRGSDGRYQDLYTFAADSSGRMLTFTLVSAAFAPELSVETPAGERVRAEILPPVLNDDGTPSRERRVVVRDLRGPGVYRVLVTSREADEAGRYVLRIREDDAVRTLAPGAAALEGELGPRTSTRVGDSYRDTYRFTGAPEREHTLRVTSSAFAPAITVTGPAGGAVAGETARSGTGLTFRFTPTRAGAYTVVVTSREPAKTGRYTVGLTVAAPPPSANTDAAAGPTLRPDGSVLRDSLAAGQTRTYAINGRIGDRVTVEVRTDGFTPGLVLVRPDGTRVPATPDGDRARVRTTLPSAGRYRVEVAGSDAGEFSITLDQQAAPTSDRIPRLPGQEPIRSEIEPNEPPPAEDGDGTYRPQPIGRQP